MGERIKRIVVENWAQKRLAAESTKSVSTRLDELNRLIFVGGANYQHYMREAGELRDELLKRNKENAEVTA